MFPTLLFNISAPIEQHVDKQHSFRKSLYAPCIVCTVILNYIAPTKTNMKILFVKVPKTLRKDVDTYKKQI